MYVEGEYVSFIIGIAKDDRRPRYWRRPRGCTRRSPGGGLGRAHRARDPHRVRRHGSQRWASSGADRFVGTWREEFFEAPLSRCCKRLLNQPLDFATLTKPPLPGR